MMTELVQHSGGKGLNTENSDDSGCFSVFLMSVGECGHDLHFQRSM
jgi:hypothetical protein